MQKLTLLAALLLCAALLTAQTPQYFFKKLDCETGHTMCFDADSNLWLGCSRAGQPLLVKMSREGILLEQVQVNTQAGSENALTELIMDSEGMIVGCGTSEPIDPNDPESSFAFRYDPKNQQMIWSRKVTDGYLFLSGIVENGPGGHFWTYGYNYGFSDIGDMVLLHRNTGELVPGYDRAYRVGNSEDIRSVVYHQGKLYSTGQNDLSYLFGISVRRYLRQNVTRFDSSGLPDWNLLGSVPLNTRSYLRGQDLLIEDGAVFSLSSGNDETNSTTSGHIFLQKTALDGTFQWLRKYDIPALPQDVANSIVSLSDGYVILAGESILFKVDKEGNFVWGQRLAGLRTDLPSFYGKAQNQLLTDGKALYLLATASGPLGSNAVFVKMDLNGNIAGCNKLSPVTVLPLVPTSPFYEKRVLSAEAAPLNSVPAATELRSPVQLDIQIDCQNEGPAPQNPCEPRTFVKQLGNNGLRERITCIRTASDTAIYLAGHRGDLATLAKMRPDGELLWVKSLPNAEPLTVVDMLTDRDGWLVGCGYRGDASGGRKGFAFRYNPSTDQMLWFQKLNSPIGSIGGIVQINAVSGHFLLTQNVLLPDGREVPESVQLNRSTGEVVPLSGRRYDPETHTQTFNAMVLEGNDLYVVGQDVATSGRRRMLLSNLTAEFGGQKWLQLGHTDTLANGSFGDYGMTIYDQKHIISAYTGHPTANGPVAPTQLFLQKTDPLGTAVWVRRYDVPLTGELDLIAVPGGYVLLGRTSPTQYILLKTDLNGNLLFAKRAVLGMSGGTSAAMTETRRRLALSGDYLFFALHNGASDVAFLIKTDLNLEVQGPCGEILPANITSGNVVGAVAQKRSQGLFVSPLTSVAQTVAWQPDELSVNQLCPPIISVPRLALGPDLTLCPGDLDTLKAPKGFQTYLWQDGSTDTMLVVADAGVYSVAVADICGRVQRDTVRVTVAPNPTKSVTLLLAPFSSVNIGGILRFAPDTVTVPEPSFSGGCDTLTTYYLQVCPPKTTRDTIAFYPGQKVTLAGISYTQPTTVTLQFLTAQGCDSTVIYTLRWLVANIQAECPTNLMLNAPPGSDRRAVDYALPTFTTDCPDPDVALLLVEGPYTGDTFLLGTTRVCYLAFSDCNVRDTCCFMVTLLPPAEKLALQCPPNPTVTAAVGSNSAAVTYALPSASTDCTDPDISIELLQGLASGATFPVGSTQVCYEASNACGIRDTCCFTVQVLPPDPPCDVKSPPGCLRYELLGLKVDPSGQRRYRVRIVNTCASPLAFAYLQLPNGVVAVSPKEGATYAAPSGNTYSVRNPNASPFYSIRFKPVVGSLNNGAGDIFEFVLPQQSAPAFLHVAARLADGSFSEAYLNVLTCPVTTENAESSIAPRTSPPSTHLSVWPNPTTGRLMVSLHAWQGQSLRLRVLDAQGRTVLERGYVAEQEVVVLDLPEGLASGMYLLTVWGLGQNSVTTTRFVLERQ